jgi:DNA invertase Pin-like site-specific DNA recombinase
MAIAREKDILVVWKLDRLGRSLPHLIATIRGLGDQGVGFRSLTENIDTTSSGGKAGLPPVRSARRVRA